MNMVELARDATIDPKQGFEIAGPPSGVSRVLGMGGSTYRYF